MQSEGLLDRPDLLGIGGESATVSSHIGESQRAATVTSAAAGTVWHVADGASSVRGELSFRDPTIAAARAPAAYGADRLVGLVDRVAASTLDQRHGSSPSYMNRESWQVAFRPHVF
jgi:hypothetical protein